MTLTAYLAAKGYLEQLMAELPSPVAHYGDLVVIEGEHLSPLWAQNCWHAPIRHPISSIGEAASYLRSLQRNWALYSTHEHRRAALIAANLPSVKQGPWPFPTPLSTQPLGSWTLLDRETLLLSPYCSSPFPNGEVHFQEDKTPPSRAYLKLWEAFTLLQQRPEKGSRCLEIGASPGSWTWVLSQCDADVLAVDRAPLSPEVAALPGVHFQKGDAFTMTPEKVGPIDWLLSDVICYPEKLLEFVQLWRASGLCRRFICTLKFQGKGDYAIARQFAALPQSRVLHLFHNKHELTWMCCV